MAAKIRSEAAFSAMLQTFGLKARVEKFKTAGWTSIGAFAVSCGFNPEKADDAKVTTVIIKAILDWEPRPEGPPEPKLANNLRHLFWECSNAFIADTRYRHDYGLGEIAIPTNPAERHARRKAFKAEREEHCPEIMEGDLEPAFCSEDDLQAQFDRDRLEHYLRPADCPKRQQELLVTTARPQARRPKAPGAPAWLTALQQGSQQELSVEIPRANVEDGYELDCAFRRRGICFHLVGLIRMPKTEQWRRKLMKALRQVPADPRTMMAPTLTDILACNKHIWLNIAEACIDGIQPSATKWPLEEALDLVLKSTTIEIMLMVRPKGTVAAGTSERAPEKTQPAQQGAAKTKAEKNKDRRNRRKTKKAASKGDGKWNGKVKNTKGKGKGNGKGNKHTHWTGSQSAKKKFVPLPKELIGCESSDSNGEPFCFGFAKGTCDKVQPGQKCDKAPAPKG